MREIDRYRDCRLLPPREAAAALGISERALRLRGQRGTIDRHREGGAVLYVVPAATATATAAPLPVPAGMPAATAAVLAPLVEALVAAERRAVAAEIEAEQLRAQLAQVRAAAAELEAAHIKRAGVIRDLAEQLRATRAAAA